MSLPKWYGGGHSSLASFLRARAPPPIQDDMTRGARGGQWKAESLVERAREERYTHRRQRCCDKGDRKDGRRSECPWRCQVLSGNKKGSSNEEADRPAWPKVPVTIASSASVCGLF